MHCKVQLKAAKQLPVDACLAEVCKEACLQIEANAPWQRQLPAAGEVAAQCSTKATCQSSFAVLSVQNEQLQPPPYAIG